MASTRGWKRRHISEHGILFVLFGYPVHIQWWFFLGAALLGLSGHRNLIGIVVWTAVTGVAILIHELGHAVAVKSLGAFPTIELHALGGLTRWTAPLRTRWFDRVIVSLAGPGLGFLAAGLLLVVERSLDDVRFSGYARLALDDFWWATMIWGGVNLMPVLPLDGGHALYAVLQRFSRRAWRLSRVISCLAGGLATIAALLVSQPFAAVLFGVLTYSAFSQLQGRPAIRVAGLE
jgi:hypothetical protein